MVDTLTQSIDARQFPAWKAFLQNIGWSMETVGNTNIAIRKLPFLNRSIIKIQHPLNPFPFTKIDAIARKYNALMVLVEPHNYLYNEQAFKKNGYQKARMHIVHSATIKIDLQKTEKKLFDSFSENAKRNIKKAGKNNVRVDIVSLTTKKSEKAFLLFYNLLSRLTKMKKFYLPSYSEQYGKMQGFKNNSVLLFAYDKDDAAPIAVLWLGYYKKVSVYLQTGITKRGYELLANYLLVWKALQFSQKKKLHVFDFESIHDERYPNEHTDWKGYTEFKKRFHGELIQYPPNWIKVYNPLLKFIAFIL